MTWLALLAPLWRLLRPLWAPLAGYLQGRRDARAAQDRAAVKAERTRQEIEDDIQQDTDLAARARKSGLVRRD